MRTVRGTETQTSWRRFRTRRGNFQGCGLKKEKRADGENQKAERKIHASLTSSSMARGVRDSHADNTREADSREADRNFRKKKLRQRINRGGWTYQEEE
jgi:hypothetical protein